MERRREGRATSDQLVRLTVLGCVRRQMDGKAIDMSGRGIRLVLPDRVSPGEPVKIDMDDGMLLGEICYCEKQGLDFVVGIQVDQALSGLTELARLNRGLFDLPPERDILRVSEQA